MHEGLCVFDLLAFLRRHQGEPSFGTFAKAIASVEANARIATMLLDRAIAYEGRGARSKARALWPVVHRRWASLSKSSRFRAWLTGCVAAGQVKGVDASQVDTAIAGIERVLLPRIHGAIAAASRDDETHESFHKEQIRAFATRFGEHQIDQEALSITRISWARVIRSLGGISPQHQPVYVLALSTSTDYDEHRLADEIAEGLDAHADASEHVEHFARLAAAAPSHLGLRHLYGRVLLRSALRHAREQRYLQAAKNMVWAAVTDPLVRREALEAFEALRHSVGGATTEATSETAWERMKFGGTSARTRVDFDAVLAFPESEKGQEVRAQTARAIVTTLAVRVGLPLDDDSWPAAASALAMCIDEGADELLAARAELIESHPLLASVDFGAIRRVMAGGAHNAAAVAIALPPIAPFPERSPAELDLAAYAKELFASASRPVSRRPLVLLDWLTSGIDPLAKLAAVAGVVMLVVGTWTYVRNGHHAARRDADWNKFQAAVAKNDSQAALSAARDFLEVTPEGAADYRSRKLADHYAKVLLVELRRASEKPDDPRLAALTEHARQLRSWLEKNPSKQEVSQ